jgi:hypothetical protein
MGSSSNKKNNKKKKQQQQEEDSHGCESIDGSCRSEHDSIGCGTSCQILFSSQGTSDGGSCPIANIGNIGGMSCLVG